MDILIELTECLMTIKFSLVKGGSFLMNNSFSETFITSFDHEISVDVVYQPSHISDCHLIRVADALLSNLR